MNKRRLRLFKFAVKDVNGRYSIKTTIREQLAKIAAVADVVFRRSPKFLGPRETLPPDKCRTFPFEWTNPDSAEVCPGLA